MRALIRASAHDAFDRHHHATPAPNFAAGLADRVCSGISIFRANSAEKAHGECLR
jgi:hypothetical protein